MDAAAAVDEIDLFAYLEILWRHRWPLLGLILAAMAAAAILSWWVIPPTYEATSMVQVGNAQLDLSLGSPETYRSILLSGPVLSRAARTSGVEKDIIGKAVKAEPVPNTNLLKLTVQSDSRERSEALGEAWQESYQTAVQEIWEKSVSAQLTSERARLEGMREYLRELTVSIPNQSGFKAGTAVLVDGDALAAAGEVKKLEQRQARIARGELSDILVVAPFKAEGKPVAPRKALNVAIAGFLALMVGVFGVFAVEGWRVRQGVAG